MMCIAVLFARLGPYHVARLRALSGDHDVVAVELSGTNLNYDWEPVATDGLTHVQLFDGNHRAVDASRLRQQVGAVLAEHAPDAVAVPGWWDPGALAALAWGRRHGVPVVLMSDSTALDAPRVWWREGLKRRVVSLFETALVAGTRHVEYLTGLGMSEDRIWTGYDVVDNDHFAEGADAARKHEDEQRAALGLPDRYVLACGRFVEKKNLERAIEAYAQYRTRTETPRALVIVGDGPRRGALQERVAALGLQEDVYFPGFCQYDELPPYYGWADAFIHASTHEQWGLVVNEAMAAGLPVLVSERCGCAPDLVADGENGVTFDPFDTDEIAEALGGIPTSESRRREMGRASRDRIRDWTPQTFARNLGAAAEQARTMASPSLAWDQSLLLRALTWKSTARVS
jgi:glycosyltransferase involved in cell wall biosynthesis